MKYWIIAAASLVFIAALLIFGKPKPNYDYPPKKSAQVVKMEANLLTLTPGDFVQYKLDSTYGMVANVIDVPGTIYRVVLLSSIRAPEEHLYVAEDTDKILATIRKNDPNWCGVARQYFKQ